MTNILDTDILKACALFASKEESRHSLNGVCYRHKDGVSTYAATNGHMGIKVTVKTDKEHEDENEAPINVEEFIIPSVAMKSLPKILTKLPVVFSPTGFTFTSEHDAQSFKRVDGDFPDIDRVLPDKAGKVMPYAGFNAEYLLVAQKAMKLLGVAGFDAVCIHPSIADGPHYITREHENHIMEYTNRTGEEVTAKIVIMPVRV